VVYANLEPRYRSPINVPDKQQRCGKRSSRRQADRRHPIDVMIEFPKGALAIRAGRCRPSPTFHALVEKQAGVGNVWSLETLRRWLAERPEVPRRHFAG